VPSRSSSKHPRASASANNLRPGAADLDEVDLAILERLAVDARIPNNALAELVGIAPSTCLARVRSLRERRVVRGFHADIDPSLTGRPIQAIVAVRIQGEGRTRLGELLEQLARLPGVLNVYLLGGAHDFFVHVAAPSTESLRHFVVDTLSRNVDVAVTETNLIFQHVQSHPVG
jgi:DNA-binding Lrp family transcriptional regulator